MHYYATLRLNMIEDIETHYLYVPTIYYEQVNVVEKRRTLLVPWSNKYVECGSTTGTMKNPCSSKLS